MQTAVATAVAMAVATAIPTAVAAAIPTAIAGSRRRGTTVQFYIENQ